MNLHKKCTSKPYYVLVIYTTLALDNSSRFRKNLLERIYKLIMTIDDKIKDEKLQYDTYREAAKRSVSSSSKIDKYEYLTGEEILPSDQSRIIEQGKFTYSLVGKVFETERKKQVDALKVLKPNSQKLKIKNVISENTLSEEAKNELNKNKEIEKNGRWRKIIL